MSFIDTTTLMLQMIQTVEERNMCILEEFCTARTLATACTSTDWFILAKGVGNG